MKIVDKEIEMISVTNIRGVITPIRFRYQSRDDEFQVIKIHKVTEQSNQKIAGKVYMVYKCQAIIDNKCMKIFELRYFLEKCTWILYKI